MAYTFKQSDLDKLVENHASMTLNGVPIAVDDVINSGDELEATTNAGYAFTNNGIYFMGQNPNTGLMSYLYFDLSVNNTVASVTFDSGSYAVISVSTAVLVPDYVVTQGDIDELGLSDSTLKINGLVAGVDSGIFEGDLLEVEAGAGFEFYPDSPHNGVNSSVYFQWQNTSSGLMSYLGFDLGDEHKTASVTFVNPGSGNYHGGLRVGAVQVDEVTGTNNVYLINSTKLAELNNERFVGTPPNVYDYGQFILSVIELPFSIPEELILDPELIMFATYQTSIEGDKIRTDKIRVDLGEISIPETSFNLLDFKNVTASIHLPRIDPLVIDVDYVIGETVSIEYIIDCYSGVATVNIYSTKIDGVVLSRQVDIGVNIPYAVEHGNPSLYNSNVDVGGDNGVTKPFIEILKNEAVLADGFFTIPIIDEDTIGNQSGYIEVENANLSFGTLGTEKEEIKAILSRGVIIQ